MNPTKLICLLLCAASIANATPRKTHGGERQPVLSEGHGHGLVKPFAKCKKWEDEVSADQMKVLQPILGAPEARMWHGLWHTGTQKFTPEEKAQLQAALTKDVVSPHEHCPIEAKNPSGENFLFMHRSMRDWVQGRLASTGRPCISAWKEIPGKINPDGTVSDDPLWKLPKGSRRVDAKSDASFKKMKEFEAVLNNKEWLKTHSLGEVGTYIEFSIHNNMHMRWATDNPPAGFHGGADFPLDGTYNPKWEFNKKEYNWLADPYGAHTNPVFWKLHGLVDSFIDKWAAANGYDEVSKDCAGRKKCYQWVGTWEGVRPEKLKQILKPVEARGLEARADKMRGIMEKSREAFKIGLLTDEEMKGMPSPDAKRLQRESKPGAVPGAEELENFVKSRLCREQPS